MKKFVSTNEREKSVTFFGRIKVSVSFLCFFVPFAVLLAMYIYYIATSKFSYARGYYLIHYLYTYDHGFVSRGLVGEIISWFFPVVTDGVTKGVIMLFAALLLIISSVCMGQTLKKTYDNKDIFRYTVFICFLLLFLPITFRLYFTDPKLDKLVWAIGLLAVYVSGKKYLVYAVPFLCVLCILVNPVFLFTSMPVIAVVLLYNAITDRSVKSISLCVFTYILIISVFALSAASEKYLGFETPQSLTEFYFSRYENRETVVYDLFYTDWLFDYFSTLKDIFKQAFQIYFIEWKNWILCLFNFVFFFFPVFAVLIVFWKKAVSCTEDKMQKLFFLICMMLPLITVPAIIVSWESPKYFANSLVAQLCIMMYLLTQRDKSVVYAFEQTACMFKNNHALLYGTLLYLPVFFINIH